MVAPTVLRPVFEAALSYDKYISTVAKPGEATNWNAAHGRVHLTAQQRQVLGGFVRRVNVLCFSGTWCGDCVHQCPMLDHIAKAAPAGTVDLRFVERPSHRALSDAFKVCGGDRVPLAIFMNEDFDFCALAGDRTLSRYRALAQKNLGASCPLPGAAQATAEIDATLQDWVNEFERAHLMLRLSTKLRQRHGD